MIRPTQHGDVTRFDMSSWRSRLVGYSVSAYMVRGVVIDTGFHGVREAFDDMLFALRPEGVLLTHEHEDHAGNVELVARRGIPIGAADATLFAVREVPPIAFYRRFTWEAMPPLVTPTAPFCSSDLRLVPMPGHSPDHHAVWDAREGTLFSGDLFLGVKVRLAHAHEDPFELVISLRAAAALNPERMFDAHRGPVAHPVAALSAKADWLEETITRITRRIDDGWTDAAIRRDVLGREGFVDWISGGEYSKRNFVTAVRRATANGEHHGRQRESSVEASDSRHQW